MFSQPSQTNPPAALPSAAQVPAPTPLGGGHRPTQTPAPGPAASAAGKRDGRRPTTPSRRVPWRGGPPLDLYGEWEYEQERGR